MTHFNYNIITEVPGLMASREQLERLYQRYRFASDHAGQKDVLEVACGSGIGLGYLSNTARLVVGGDIDPKNLAIARGLYANDDSRQDTDMGGIEVVALDAHQMQFPDESFDLVLLYEAIYYLQDASRFIAEASRILRGNGILIICTVNKDWKDFLPSPFSYKHYSVPELHEIIKGEFPTVSFYGAFPVQKDGIVAQTVSVLKRAAVRLELIPGSLKARTLLKRLFFGTLSPIPTTIEEGMAAYTPPTLIPGNRANTDYKIIYALCRK